MILVGPMQAHAAPCENQLAAGFLPRHQCEPAGGRTLVQILRSGGLTLRRWSRRHDVAKILRG